MQWFHHKLRRFQIPEDGADDRHRVETRLTLGLSELALVNTSLNGFVEMGIESGLEGKVDIIGRRNIFFDGLTAVLREEKSVSDCGRKPDATT